MINLEHGAVMSYQAVTNPRCLKGLENFKNRVFDGLGVASLHRQ